MQKELINFIQQNSPDGGFLQSEEWRKFQEVVGRKTYDISTSSAPTGVGAPSPYKGEGDIEFHANVIEHVLPVVGKYLYVPRGPIIREQGTDSKEQYIKELINLAKKSKAGWIRIEPNSGATLQEIKEFTRCKITKAPHDVQPKELFIIDVAKSEEQLLAEMKSKTRYNIRLAEKKGVKIYKMSNDECRMTNGQETGKYLGEFTKLTEIMAKRNGIVAHPGNYYKKMFETIPGNILKLYLAEYEGKIICANLVIFYGKTCTYLHGASDDNYRNVMAPYLLQWQQILDAKAAGCNKYDFGGVKIKNGESGNSWAGITRFKLGFSSDTKPTEFPGCYDVVISPVKYKMYRLIQRLKGLAR